MFLKRKKSKYSFTILELLLTVAIIAILATAVLALINPKKQIEKAWDGKRKKELSTLQKVLEDWYNDKNCYPKPSEICYQTLSETEGYICGNEPTSPDFSPYLNKLPCDPQHPNKKYLYQVDNFDCPSSYKIYALISENPNTGSYNYGVTSSNISLLPYPTLIPQSTSQPPTFTPIPSPQITCPPDPANKFCYKNSICNTCGTFSNCQLPGACNFPLQLYSDFGCQNPCYQP